MKKIYTLLVLLIAFKTMAQSGVLDATFGNNGKVHTGFGASNAKANAVAVQPDGKIIVGGAAYTANTVTSWQKDSQNFTLIRYNTDGSIDNAFGIDGKVMTDFYSFFSNNNYSTYIYSIRLQADGKIMVYGAADLQIILARYNNDGSLDAAFGSNGKVICSSSPVEGGNTLLIQPDGKIVVLGIQWTQPTAGNYNTQFVVERYNSDGTVDANFATAGRIVTVFGAGLDMPKAIALQPDGKIIAVGKSYNNQMAIGRYTTNGALDTTFDGDGKIITSFGAGTSSTPNFVTVHPDGKILVVGTSGPVTGNTVNLMFTKYNANGSLDNSFGTNGKAINPFNTEDLSYNINSISEQSDGKILVATSAYLSTFDQNDAFVTRRYNSDATTDASFGNNGKVTTTFQTGYNKAQYIAFQSDAKILVAGFSHPLLSDENDFNIARYNSNGTLDSTFDTDGKVTAKFESANDESNILLIQPDHKLLAIGIKRNQANNGFIYKDLALSRYNSNGSLDTSFGTEGKVVSAFGQNINKTTKAALQPNGKIIVANTFYNHTVDNIYHYEILRYNSNGSIDSTFGTDGKVTLEAEPSSILSQTDGKIITASLQYDAQNNTFLILTRFNNNGTLDSSFGTAGTAAVAGKFYGPTEAVMQADGKIVVSTSSPDENANNGFVAMRFNTNGSLDNSFATVRTIVDVACNAAATFIQPDGKILVAGRSFGVSDGYVVYQFVVARYNTNGSLDTSYGTNGTVATHLGGPFEPYNIIQAIVCQPDGKFLVALSKVDQTPSSPDPSSYDFVIYRFNAEGGYDNDFGTNGQLSTTFYNKYDEAFSMMLQPDNKIVVAGTTDTGINRDFALARYENTIVLAVDDWNQPDNLALYPNPTTDILNIKVPGNYDFTKVKVTIVNMFGQTVFTSDEGNAKINVCGFQTGVYELNVTTDKGNWSRKFIRD